MAVPKLRDERLCWLAVRDELARRSRRRPLSMLWLALTGVLGFGGTANRSRHAAASRSLSGYSFAVDQAARKLTLEERQVLRSTGKVPDWFLDEVETLRKADRGTAEQGRES
jgi:hypothetical protein